MATQQSLTGVHGENDILSVNTAASPSEHLTVVNLRMFNEKNTALPHLCSNIDGVTGIFHRAELPEYQVLKRKIGVLLLHYISAR